MSKSINVLKAEAVKLGIIHSPNIGVETLAKKISDELMQRELAADTLNGESQQQRANRLRHSANKMLRVEVTCLNPRKVQEQGLWAIGSNSVVGTIKEYVPCGVPWHITQMSYNIISEKMFTQSKPGKAGGRGERVTTAEYQITELEALTPNEVKRLKRTQEATAKLAADQDN